MNMCVQIKCLSFLTLVIGILFSWVYFNYFQDHPDTEIKVLSAEDYCPGHGFDEIGGWVLDDKMRCILRCWKGYEPSGCHVLRKINGRWNNDIPNCIEASYFSKRKLGCLMAALGAVATSPNLLYQLGFSSSVAVVKDSIAVMLQGPSVSVGRLFNTLQSLGMADLKREAAIELVSKMGSACDGLVGLFSSCEDVLVQPLIAADFCPASVTQFGSWYLNFKDGLRCILKCAPGYEPSGCHILRKNKQGQWNGKVPTCEQILAKVTTNKMIIYSIVAVGIVISSPNLVYQLGLSTFGIAKETIYAVLHEPSVSAWPWVYTMKRGEMFEHNRQAAVELVTSIQYACTHLFFYSCEQE